MLKLTFPGPVVIHKEALAALLQIVATAVLVEPHVEADPAAPKVRAPRVKANAPAAPVAAPNEAAATETAPTAAADAPDPEPEVSGAEQEPARRGRKAMSDEEKAAAKALRAAAAEAVAKVASPTVAAVVTAVAPELLERFSSLIDLDYDKALGLLEQFGVARFSALPADEHEAFAKELDQLGV